MLMFILGCCVKTKALLACQHVLRDGTLYVHDPPTRAGREAVIWEFQRSRGNRWECVGVGRHDQPQYAGMFSAEGTSSP
jgi:hypothetical protein